MSFYVNLGEGIIEQSGPKAMIDMVLKHQFLKNGVSGRSGQAKAYLSQLPDAAGLCSCNFSGAPQH